MAARDELLVCIGAVPDRIETGYGHVEPGDAIDVAGAARAFHVRAFHEKPDPETAGRYVDEGYLWNTGIFVWKAATFLEEVRADYEQVREDHASRTARHVYLPLQEARANRFTSDWNQVPITTPKRLGVTVLNAPVRGDRAGLERVVALVGEGTFKPAVEKTYALEAFADAYARIETGHSRGKIVFVNG